jgi:hypothetical protein
MVIMLISDKYKYVFIAHESTASRSISEFLTNHEFDIRGGQHELRLETIKPDSYAEAIKNYTWFTVVRHPFTRLLSIWDRCHFYDETNPAHPSHYGFTFQNFIEHIKTFNCGCVPISQFCRHENAYKIDLALRYENLPNCLSQLPFVKDVNLPEIGKGSKERIGLDTPENRVRVYALYKEDYDAFGYAA